MAYKADLSLKLHVTNSSFVIFRLAKNVAAVVGATSSEGFLVNF